MAGDARRVGLTASERPRTSSRRSAVGRSANLRFHPIRRPGAQDLAMCSEPMGWRSEDRCPQELDAAIIFAPVGALVPSR